MQGTTFLNAVTNSRTDILQALFQILEEAQAGYCVIGGLAVNAYAEPVVSLDLDVVVTVERLEAVCQAAAARGLKVERLQHSVNLSSSESDLRVQLQTDSRYQAFIARSVPREVLGYRMRVAALEDVLQGKVWAYQDETQRRSKRQKDLAGILRLVEAHPGLERQLSPALRAELE